MSALSRIKELLRDVLPLLRRLNKRALGPRVTRTITVFSLFVTAPRVADAHAIHTTLTVISAEKKAITLHIRSFADDFSVSVAQFARHSPPRDSSAVTSEIISYIRAKFVLTDSRGRPVLLESCGVRRAGALYLLCFRASLPVDISGIKIRNQMLTELYNDQVNIVQIDRSGRRKTALFTKGSPAITIEPIEAANQRPLDEEN